MNTADHQDSVGGYNLRSRKVLEDSNGHTTKSSLATKKTAAWRHAWLLLIYLEEPEWREGFEGPYYAISSLD